MDLSRLPVTEIRLLAEPPLARTIFARLARAGLHQAALFGGAIRDTDCGAAWGMTMPVKDYDVRIWLATCSEEEVRTALQAMEQAFGSPAHMEPSPGTGRPRYIFRCQGVEVDVSFRAVPGNARDAGTSAGAVTVAVAVALDRVMHSDAALSAVALDMQMRAWARPEYLEDRDGSTLSFYPADDAARGEFYRAKMIAKFPGRILRIVDSVQQTASNPPLDADADPDQATATATATGWLAHRPGFAAWNAGNALVDETGNPVVWHHATDAAEEFNIFTVCGEGSVGFHFGPVAAASVRLQHIEDPDLHGRILPVVIRASSPLHLPDQHTWDFDSIMAELEHRGLATPEMSQAVVDSADLDFLYAALELAGFDAVTYPNETEGGSDSSIFVWHAEQVKSVFAASFGRADSRILPQAATSHDDVLRWKASRAGLHAAREELLAQCQQLCNAPGDADRFF